MNIKGLKEYLTNTPLKQVQKEWKELKDLDKGGMPAEEYIKMMKQKYKQKQ